MFYYQVENKRCCSLTPLEAGSLSLGNVRQADLIPLPEEEAAKTTGPLFFLRTLDPKTSRLSFVVNHPALLFHEQEGLNLLQLSQPPFPLSPWLSEQLQAGQVISVNTAYPNWQEALSPRLKAPYRIHVVGLGDVGGTLLTGLRLLGGDTLSAIGIYDRDESKLRRWEFEANQIHSPVGGFYPPVVPLTEPELFNCDLLAFCVAVSVPALGQEQQDVRMAQFEANGKVVATYARLAVEQNFQGIFAVVSDPVDLLCKSALVASRDHARALGKDQGLLPEQIRGYGLGVMAARARYYATQLLQDPALVEQVRAFGPHGADLVVANSLSHYEDELSLRLTELTCTANLKLRETGYKPYVAPALSSGALSLLATLREQWHDSATFVGGVYLGTRNRWQPQGTTLENLSLPPRLFERISATYHRLEAIL